MKLTLIGLGGKTGDLTLSGKLALDAAERIIARTRETESFKQLENYNAETLDNVFTSSRNFDTLNKNLAAAVINAAKTSPVVYCVDGAVSEDEACAIILKKHKETEVIEGVSRVSTVKNAAALRRSNVTAVSAYDVRSLKSCPAAVVYDIDDDFAASEVKIVLSDLFGEESDCFFVRGDKAVKIKIYEIDRQKNYSLGCSVAVEEGEYLKKARYDFADLEQMIRLLRAPGGCPWDRVQTCESIKSNVIEEAYELADAIERGDDDGIREETGDILLQAAFHSVLKEEQGAFNGNDALTEVVKKLIFRHSHVFGKEKAADDTEALGVWDKNKKKEKGQSTVTETVCAVPKNMPACMRAQKVGKRAGKVMDFLSPVSASEKLFEEVNELLDALVKEDKNATFEEAGDVLYSAVNVCRLAGVDCEDALHAAADKFIKRFAAFEKFVTDEGGNIYDLDPSRWDYYWMLAKNAIKEN